MSGSRQGVVGTLIQPTGVFTPEIPEGLPLALVQTDMPAGEEADNRGVSRGDGAAAANLP